MRPGILSYEFRAISFPFLQVELLLFHLPFVILINENIIKVTFKPKMLQKSMKHI